MDVSQSVLRRCGEHRAGQQPPFRIVLRHFRIGPKLVKAGEAHQRFFLGEQIVRDLLAVLGLLPLVISLGRTIARRLTAAERNDGFSRMVSLLALMSLDPILVSFAQDGTRPQFAIRRRRSRVPSSRRSTTIGTFWVGATFQLGPGGFPSTSLASKWLRRSLVALDITYLPQMSPFCPTEPVKDGDFRRPVPPPTLCPGSGRHTVTACLPGSVLASGLSPCQFRVSGQFYQAFGVVFDRDADHLQTIVERPPWS